MTTKLLPSERTWVRSEWTTGLKREDEKTDDKGTNDAMGEQLEEKRWREKGKNTTKALRKCFCIYWRCLETPHSVAFEGKAN